MTRTVLTIARIRAWLHHPRLRNPSDDTYRIISSALALFSSIAVCYLLVAQTAVSARSTCQVRYDHAFAVQANARTAAGDQDHAAVYNLITGVFSPRLGETIAQQRSDLERLYANYRSSENDITRQRTAHKYPPLPNC